MKGGRHDDPVAASLRRKNNQQKGEQRQRRKDACRKAISRETVADRFVEALCKAHPALLSRSPDERRQLVCVASMVLWPSRRRRHTELEGFCSIHGDELDVRFGQGKFAPLNKSLQLFEIAEPPQGSMTTRGYRLCPRIQEALVRELRAANRGEHLTSHRSQDGKRKRKPPPVIVGESQRKASVPATVGLTPCNREELIRLSDTLDRISDIPPAEQAAALRALGYDGKLNIPELIIRIELCLNESALDFAGLGVMPHSYVKSKAGRWMAKGVNLQGAPKIIKQAALSGLIQYDWVNCHITMLYQLSRRAKPHEALPYMQRYVDDAGGVREQLVAELGMSEKETKQVLIALGYGAPRSTHVRPGKHGKPGKVGEIANILGGIDGGGRLRARTLFDYSLIQGLVADMQKAKQIVLRSHEAQTGEFDNVMGLRFIPKVHLDKFDEETGEPEEKRQIGARIAHLLQGCEAKMLEVALSLHGTSITLLEHDGFCTCAPINEAQLITAIREHPELGFKMKLKSKKVVAPRVKPENT